LSSDGSLLPALWFDANFPTIDNPENLLLLDSLRKSASTLVFELGLLHGVWRSVAASSLRMIQSLSNMDMPRRYTSS
jgi:hypothetical protein